jgi:hypothetical protein
MTQKYSRNGTKGIIIFLAENESLIFQSTKLLHRAVNQSFASIIANLIDQSTISTPYLLFEAISRQCRG